MKNSATRKIAALVACATLAGCGENWAYVGQTYADEPPTRYQVDGRTWRIFDRPAIDRMMITPTLGDAAAAGAVKGATFALAPDYFSRDEHFRPAAAAYLATRGCTITRGRLLINTQYEFEYECAS